MKLVKVMGSNAELRLSAVDCAALAKVCETYLDDSCIGNDQEQERALVSSMGTAFKGLAVASELIASFMPTGVEAIRAAVEDVGLQDLVGL